MATMQAAVQDRILTQAVIHPGASTSELLEGCPRGANERDVRRAVQLLRDADAVSGSPLALTAEGLRRFVPAWRRARGVELAAQAAARLTL